MIHKIFIDGETGTTGLEIKKRLTGQKDLNILQISPDRKKDKNERLRLYNEADLVFLCLPDSESELISKVADSKTKIIDASSAHRTEDDWVYGLPELSSDQREKIRKSNRIANPGCHATGFILLIRPLIDAGLISSDVLLSAHSITGYSGGGKAMIADYEQAKDSRDPALDSPGQYGLSQHHKHLPEMVKSSGMTVSPVFTPIVGDYYRGMLVSIPLHRSMLTGSHNLNGRDGPDFKHDIAPGDICDFYKKRYEGDSLISVRTEEEAAVNGFIYAGGLQGRDDLEIIICGDHERMTLMARYDNLGKGASGAAIQNMNLMLNRPEYEGLIR